ncbi:MAG: response regulator transcription factor [Leptolyngbyaceae cyanobacterium SM1_1_3]|nr:response regulator transcription factor [Leptolyngbyaceae cyanobacterium SM1_1_3]NJN02636.1 response regulator transcription factor [Leptolyngbyaceae cyanobacterium RM1_1_2]NJO09959.1 response regulator transcription factor [Leptolyngbyaceae cyanobacterium SL_1_1]
MTSSPPVPSLIRILIVDDHPIVRNGLALMVKYESGMKTVAEASSGTEAIAQFHQHQPDVTLMDLRLGDTNGVEVIATIRQDFPKAHIIILTTYDTDEDIYRGLQAGAKGYILKDAPLDELLKAIHTVHAGRQYIPPEVGAKLAERLSRPQLSERERDVLQLMAQGKSNQKVAKSLHIAENTVKYHVNNILSKLGVSDRTQAVLLALKRGIANL